MNLLRILRFSPLVGGLVLLLASCGAHAPVTGTSFNPPSTGSITGPPTEGTGSPPTEGTGGTGSPPTEGTGLESPQSPTSGVSVSVAGLPTGDGNQAGVGSGNYECIEIQWLGPINQPGVTVTITGVAVVGGQFTTVDAATAGCPSALCVGSHFSDADNNGAGNNCYVGVEYIGPPVNPDGSNYPAQGMLAFSGKFTCTNVDLATCQQYSGEVTGKQPVGIRFYGPPPPPGSGTGPPGSGPPPGSGSP